MKSFKLAAILVIVLMTIGAPPAKAGSHLWKFAEAFSNADGTIQFIELVNPNTDNFETNIPGHVIQSNGKNYTIPSPALPANTAFKRLLFATPGFAALPGVPTPDYIFPAGSVPFFSTGGDTLACTGWPSMTFGAGVLPTDGIHSLVAGVGGTCPCTTAVNSPTNYAGTTGSIDVSPSPPGVPDGKNGSTPMTVSKVNVAGTSLSVAFDTTTCSGVSNRQIIYGQGSQLPAAPGGIFQLTGSACSVTTSPFTWNPAPAPTGGTGLVWWLMTVRDNSTNKEGSWGKGSDGLERVGPGAGGTSGQCGVVTRAITNACGH